MHRFELVTSNRQTDKQMDGRIAALPIDPIVGRGHNKLTKYSSGKPAYVWRLNTNTNVAKV